MTDRRGFLFGIAGALAAPSIVRAESLMKLWVPEPVMDIITMYADFPSPNRILTTELVMRNAVRMLIDMKYESEFGRYRIKIGSQPRIRLPNDYASTNGGTW